MKVRVKCHDTQRNKTMMTYEDMEFDTIEAIQAFLANENKAAKMLPFYFFAELEDGSVVKDWGEG